MKAFVADADWVPRKGYLPGDREKARHSAAAGNMLWKNPRFEFRNVPEPECNDNDVIIKVENCGVCGSDTHIYETDEEGYIIFSGLTKFPCILGHEFAGVVEETGKKVNGLKKGDKVSVESVLWCGICEPCRSGAYNQCRQVELMGLSVNGAMTEYIGVDEKYCWKINEFSKRYDEEKLFEIGSLIEPVGCAYNGIFIAGRGFRPGAAAVVFGVGPIGLGSVALLKASGASIIVAFDTIDERVRIALEMGADYAFNANNLNGRTPSEIINELTNGSGADIQIEAAGDVARTIPEMEKSMSFKGKIIYLGRSPESATLNLNTFVSGENNLIGSRGHAGSGVFPSIIRLIASGKLEIEKMITARYKFDSAMDALKASCSRTEGKILVKI